MIFDELRILNFGVYRGEHIVEMTPPSLKKPVLLFGGLNGSGKTTFLDALQLVLYGKMARCSNRGSMAYDQFLRKSINRDVPLEHGAELALKFSHIHAGKKRQVIVTRRWSCVGEVVKEHLEVKTRLEGERKETYDPVMAENWQEHVESFIPGNISPLFFFDGEKIEALADLDKSKEILRTAIQGLLGLDLVDRLEGDLEILERQKRLQQKPESERSEIYALETQIAQEEKIVERFHSDMASQTNEILMAEQALEKSNREFAAEGGAFYEQRDLLANEKTNLEKAQEVLKGSSQDMAAGPLPLLMLDKSLENVRQLDAQEEMRESLRTTLKLLEKRDETILKNLKKKLSTADWTQVETMLEKDLTERQKTLQGESALLVSRSGRLQLAELLDFVFKHITSQAEGVCNEADELEEKLVSVKRKLSAVPSDTRLANVVKKQERARLDLIQANSRKKGTEEALSSLRIKLDDLKRKRNVLLQKNLEGNEQIEDSERLVKHSLRLRETLEKFRAVIVEKNVQKIQFHVMESFKKLFRKKTLLIDIRIDPETLEIELIGTSNHKISPERLSAGERQILATSLLWGLARSAGRTLPAVIDTPLGRLDTKHRINLVERYFPFASHQVVLLSTDEEINRHYYDRIKPFVGHEYTMAFNEEERTSTIVKGYFGDKE